MNKKTLSFVTLLLIGVEIVTVLILLMLAGTGYIASFEKVFVVAILESLVLAVVYIYLESIVIYGIAEDENKNPYFIADYKIELLALQTTIYIMKKKSQFPWEECQNLWVTSDSSNMSAKQVILFKNQISGIQQNTHNPEYLYIRVFFI